MSEQITAATAAVILNEDCGWILIYNQLEKQGKLEFLKKFRPPRDYQLSGWRVTT